MGYIKLDQAVLSNSRQSSPQCDLSCLVCATLCRLIDGGIRVDVFKLCIVWINMIMAKNIPIAFSKYRVIVKLTVV